MAIFPSIRFMTTNSLPLVKLYQYNICPFCHKTKTILRFAGIRPKEVVEVNPITKAELNFDGNNTDQKKNKDNVDEKIKKYRKVPIAFIDGQQVNGSDAIISTLLQNKAVKDSILSRSPSLNEWEDFIDSEKSSQWKEFIDKDLASILYPNICSSLGSSFAAFQYVHSVETFSILQKVFIQTIGSLAMYIAASKIKSKYNIDDEFVALQEALKKWKEKGLANGNQIFFSGKSDPSLNDLLVYGILHSIDGLPAHEKILNHSDNKVINAWYHRVKGRINNTFE